MSFDVGLLVSFRCSELDGIAALARRHLAVTKAEADRRSCPEAAVFLEELTERSGPADRGPKNGLTAWTYGGNYTRPREFVDILRPFWDDLLRHPVAGGPLRVHHILVLYQLPDCDEASAIEIYLDKPPLEAWESEEAWQEMPRIIETHEGLPFGWS